jgi:asparagine synthase (glutamine-hydrolysing)
MCGIFGIVFKDSGREIPESLLKESALSMNHRGPDDEGIYISHNPITVGLAHRRLSIIDLSSAGHQPMSNEDETIWIVLNGEIYNFRELRYQLEVKGHTFKSRTDTEVIVHSYEEWGKECVERLQGMFAFAVYDKRKGVIFLGRDRLGIKPLYFYNDERVFIFASEIKAILGTGFVKPEVNYDAIDFYISLGYVPAPETLFKRIYKLQPGYSMTINKHGLYKYQYWHLNSFERCNLSFEESCEKLRGLLNECIKSHLMSDVPLGVFLSGGIDSSSVVAFMSKILNTPVKTFSVGYEDAVDISELEYARKIAKRFGTEHHEFILKPVDFFESIKTFLHYSEEPIIESAAIALYQLSKLAKSYVTVLLSGEGADEIFGGYPLYWKMKNIERFYRFSKFFPLIMKNIPSKLLPEKHQKYLYWISVPFPQRYRTVSCDVIPNIRDSIYTESFREIIDGKVEYFFEETFSKLSGKSILQKMLYVDTKYWLPDDLLLKADKMTMATSVELRVPFLDHKLVEFAYTLPDCFKVDNREGKLILKKIVEGILPDEIIFRRKRGFPVPITKWFSEDLYSKATEVLLDEKTLKRGYFNKSYIEKILFNHKKGQDLSRRIFSLLVLELWHRKYIDGESL